MKSLSDREFIHSSLNMPRLALKLLQLLVGLLPSSISTYHSNTYTPHFNSIFPRRPTPPNMSRFNLNISIPPHRHPPGNLSIIIFTMLQYPRQPLRYIATSRRQQILSPNHSELNSPITTLRPPRQTPTPHAPTLITQTKFD